MRQIVPIPADRADEFDLVVDVAIRPKTSFDASRVETRLRIPLGEVIVGAGRGELRKSFEHAIDGLLGQGMTIPPKRVGDGA